MSLVSAFIILLLCLSMHACHARYFLLFSQDSPTRFQSLQEVKEKTTPSLNPAEENFNKSIDTKEETHNKELVSEAKESVTSIQSSGNEIPKSSSLAVSIKATDTQGSTRRALSPVGFGSNFKEAADINKNKLQDVEQVEDYDPPHGTPPIHNRKT